MKFTTSIVAILSAALITLECSAEPPGRGRGENGKNAAGQRGERKPGAAGQRGERKPGAAGQRPGPGGQRDPAQIVARMMQEFDKDGDSKLNVTELTALLKSMRERRTSGEGRGAGVGQRRSPGQKPGGAGKDGQKPGGKSQRRQGGENKATPGGERPKRPAAE